MFKMDRTSFFMLTFILIRFGAIHCIDPSTTADTPQPPADVFCEALFKININFDNYIEEITLMETFVTRCKNTFETVRIHVAEDDVINLKNFPSDWCIKDPNSLVKFNSPDNCATLAKTFIETLNYSLKSISDVCLQYKKEYKVGHCTMFKEKLFKYNVTSVEWIQNKESKLSCVKCIDYIENCNETTKTAFEEISERISTDKTFQNIRICDAIWLHELLPHTDQNEIFSVLLETSHWYKDGYTHCTKENYEVVVTYLLNSKRPDFLKYFKEPLMLGFICYYNMLQPPLSYTLELIENFLDENALIDGMDVIKDLGSYGIPANVFLDLHNYYKSTIIQLNKNASITKLIETTSKVRVGILKPSTSNDTYFSKIIIPVFNALRKYYEQVDNINN